VTAIEVGRQVKRIDRARGGQGRGHDREAAAARAAGLGVVICATGCINSTL
jgi:hypothetical protein